MFTELREEIELSLAQLRQLAGTLRDVRESIKTRDPNETEIMALAAFVHSFYTGVENLFKRIAIATEGKPPRGELWHVTLLAQMAQATPSRPAVISEDLRKQLKDYLDFRHVFRHAYVFELKWSRMAPLVLEMESVLRELEKEIRRFLSAIGANNT